MLHLWRASLGFRVVVVTMLLGILVLTAVGTYLYGSIAQGLVDSRQRIAAEDSLRDATDAQSKFDSTDQNDTPAELTQFATTLVKPVPARRRQRDALRRALAAARQQRRRRSSSAAIESGSVGVRFIPDELRAQVAAQPDRQHLQVATIEEGNDTISAVIVGQRIDAARGRRLRPLLHLPDAPRARDHLASSGRPSSSAAAALILLIGAIAFVVTRLVADPVRRAAMRRGAVRRRQPQRAHAGQG